MPQNDPEFCLLTSCISVVDIGREVTAVELSPIIADDNTCCAICKLVSSSDQESPGSVNTSTLNELQT